MSRRTGLSSRSSKLLATVREDGDYDPQDENRRSKSGTDVSPPCRVRWGESINPVQKERARAADPNGGACLLTGRKAAIETSHALARATHHVTQLEWVWGMKKGTFYIDTRYNLLFLRADWHTLFDKDMWMLIPNKNDLKELERATARLEEEVEQYRIALEEVTRCPQGQSKPSFEDIKRPEFGSLFNKEYEYHFLPMPNMEEPICRYSGPNFDNHKEFKFPYHTLGTLKSHIKPHFVAYNAGMKLRSQNSLTVASQIFPRHQIYPDQSTLVTVQFLYLKWAAIVVPEDFADHPNEAEQGSDEDDDDDQGSRKGKSDRLQRSNNGKWSRQSDGGGGDRGGSTGGQDRASHAGSSGGREMRGQGHRRTPDDCEGSIISSSSESGTEFNNSTGSEETTWVEEVASWMEKGAKTAEMEGGWESTVLNDDQVESYRKEHPQAVSCGAMACITI